MEVAGGGGGGADGLHAQAGAYIGGADGGRNGYGAIPGKRQTAARAEAHAVARVLIRKKL